MEAHHYLGFRSPFGAALRPVAELPDREWTALLGWSPGAFEVGARECWLLEQQFRLLHSPQPVRLTHCVLGLLGLEICRKTPSSST